MKCLNWSTEKNEILKRERGICFEEIAYLIESDQIIGIEENAARPEQKIYILEIDNYAVVVPFVENDREIFLKNSLSEPEIYKTIRIKGGIMKKNKKAFAPIDQEEEELMASIEHDDWQPVDDLEQEKIKAVAAARNTLKKDRRINLRLTEQDYYRIQIKAAEEGIPYQTLISSIVHKYLNGTLRAKA